MAIFLDGFDQFGRTDRPEQYIRLAGYTLGGQATMVTGRKGGYAMSLYRANLQRTVSFTGNQLTIGFAMRYDKRGGLFAIAGEGSSTFVVGLRVDDTNGLMYLNGVPSYIAPLINRWYYFELEMDKSAGTITLVVNGKADISVPLPAEVAGQIVLTWNAYQLAANDFATKLLDDMYINDGTRLSPMQITTRFPTSTVDDDWQVTYGSHFAAVSPPIDTLNKYIYSGTADAHDSFKSSTPLPDASPIRYLQLLTLYRKATSDPLSLELNIDDQKVTLTNLPRDWTYAYTPMSPAGYDASSIIDAEFGVRLKV